MLFASLVGTTIEFFDFYIYATAAVLVFPRLFFPANDPASAVLLSFATFGVAFLARPIGSVLFGHFGDRVGRKTTLVLALLTMGLSTVLIGALPTHKSIGVAAPILLALCRFGQGLGLGGEWGGAVLLAAENAPPNKRALYGMFPQLGAPFGFLLSGLVYLALSHWMTDQQFFAFGWRLPFLASAALVLMGLYVRLTIIETPVFREASRRGEQLRVPLAAVVKNHLRATVAGVLASLATFVIVYILMVFTLSWGTRALGYSRTQFLTMQLFGMLFFAGAIPLSALIAERGRRSTMIAVSLAISVFGIAFGPLFQSGLKGTLVMIAVGFTLTGLTYGPLGTVLAELFPTQVRYTASSLAFSMGGILGGSVAPYVATALAQRYGLSWVGYYLTAATLLGLVGLLMIRETKDTDLTATTMPVLD